MSWQPNQLRQGKNYKVYHTSRSLEITGQEFDNKHSRESQHPIYQLIYNTTYTHLSTS